MGASRRVGPLLAGLLLIIAASAALAGRWAPSADRDAAIRAPRGPARPAPARQRPLPLLLPAARRAAPRDCGAAPAAAPPHRARRTRCRRPRHRGTRLYDVLGVPQDADDRLIKKAYKRHAL
jgi:hypothetical protein